MQQRWEYVVVNLVRSYGMNYRANGEKVAAWKDLPLFKMMKQMGENGYELTAYDGENYIFKRQWSPGTPEKLLVYAIKEDPEKSREYTFLQEVDGPPPPPRPAVPAAAKPGVPGQQPPQRPGAVPPTRGPVGQSGNRPNTPPAAKSPANSQQARPRSPQDDDD